MEHQGTRRKESGYSGLKMDSQSRVTAAAGNLPASSISPKRISSESENIVRATLESSRHNIGDTSLDNARITMRTRVAVRDKTPHRFQVVPLRDVGRASGHSFNSAENRLPSCATPATPKKSSNQDFSAASTFGWKYKSDLTSLDAVSPKRMSLNRKGTSFCGSTVGVNYMPPPGTDIKSTDSVRSSTGNPSPCAADSGMVLSEWHTNLAHNLRGRHDPDTASQMPSPLSIDSIHELIRSESPLTQTISRSLRCRAPSINSIKSSSLNNMVSFNSQQADMPLDSNTANSQRLTHHPPVCRDSDDQSYYSLLDAYKTSESTPAVSSTKRHAIYTPSIYVPYCDKEVNLGNNIGPSQGTNLSFRDLSDNRELRIESGVDCSSEDDPDTTIRPERDTNPEDLADRADLSTPDGSQGLKHKSSSRSLPLCIPRGLNHSKPLASVKHVATTDGSRPGAMVYPRIVLSLFAELDNAIDEWSQ